MFESGYCFASDSAIVDRSEFAWAMRHARFQSRHSLESVVAALFRRRLRAVRVGSVFRDRNIEISRIVLDRKLKTGRHDADHGVRPPIERDGASDYIRIAAEMFFPEVVTDNNLEAALPAAALFIVPDKRAPQFWFDAENVEKFPTDLYAMDTGGSFFTGQRERAVSIDGAAREGAVLVPEIEEVRIRKRTEIGLPLLPGIGHTEGDELLRLGEWQVVLAGPR